MSLVCQYGGGGPTVRWFSGHFRRLFCLWVFLWGHFGAVQSCWGVFMTFCNVVVWIIFKFRNLRVIQINLNQTESECCVCLSLRHCLRWLLLLAIFVRLDVVRWQDWDASSCFRMAMLLPLLNVDVSPSTVGYTITVASLFSPSFRSCRLLLFGLFFLQSPMPDDFASNWHSCAWC